MKWTPDGKALIYMASRGGQIAMFKQSLSGGQPQEIAQFNDELFDFDYLDNDQLLAVTRGAWQHDVVLISGFGH